MSSRALTIGLWLALVGAVGAAYALLLPACGLLPGTNYCPEAPIGLAGESERGAALTREVAELEKLLMQRRLACAIVPPPPQPPLELPKSDGPPRPQQTAALKPPEKPPERPKPPEKPPEKPKPPEPVLKIPEKPTNDLSFIKGCWRTDPFKHRPTQPDFGISTYCFDEQGNGRLEFKRQGKADYVCRPTARARFSGGNLVIQDSDTNCSNGDPWWADHLTCRRDADGVALCSGYADGGPGGRDEWTVRLHRVR